MIGSVYVRELDPNDPPAPRVEHDPRREWLRPRLL